jgi:hypothetical protein
VRSTSPPLADDTQSTISVDKMTRIQALERIVPGLPMLPGEVERREFEYRRHGTQTRIATSGEDKFAMATFSPKSCSGNLGCGLRYKLGYSDSTAGEKYQSYQSTGGELVSSRPHHCRLPRLLRRIGATFLRPAGRSPTPVAVAAPSRRRAS